MTSYSFMHTLSSPRKEFCPSIKPGGKTREGRRDGRFQRGSPAPNVVYMIIYSRAYHGGAHHSNCVQFKSERNKNLRDIYSWSYFSSRLHSSISARVYRDEVLQAFAHFSPCNVHVPCVQPQGHPPTPRGALKSLALRHFVAVVRKRQVLATWKQVRARQERKKRS